MYEVKIIKTGAEEKEYGTHNIPFIPPRGNVIELENRVLQVCQVMYSFSAQIVTLYVDDLGDLDDLEKSNGTVEIRTTVI